jgi:AcrR family transcriptional regulator
MSTITPKQREIRGRETRILKIARDMIVQDGYHGLNMDRVADEMQLSKGTIYNHFSCKEEIIIALAIESAEKRREMFQRAAEFHGCSRFRMLAIAQADTLFFEKYPQHFEFERMLRIDSILQKTSEKRRLVMQMCESNCMAIVGGIVRDAVASSDLHLPTGLNVEEFVFGMWSLHYGSQTIVASSEDLAGIGVKNPMRAIATHVATLMDGFGWKPNSDSFDVDEVIERIRLEVFPNE